MEHAKLAKGSGHKLPIGHSSIIGPGRKLTGKRLNPHGRSGRRRAASRNQRNWFAAIAGAMTWRRVSSSGGIADAASVLVNAMDRRTGDGRRSSRSSFGTDLRRRAGSKSSAPFRSELHLKTMLTDKCSRSTTARLRNRAGNNRDDGPLELTHAGDSTTANLKTLDFSPRSELLQASGGKGPWLVFCPRFAPVCGELLISPESAIRHAQVAIQR